MKQSQRQARYGGGVGTLVNPFGGVKGRQTFDGSHALLRTTNVSPSFWVPVFSDFNASEVVELVKLDPKSDRREAETGSNGMIRGTRTGFSSKALVPLTFEEREDGKKGGGFQKSNSSSS